MPIVMAVTPPRDLFETTHTEFLTGGSGVQEKSFFKKKKRPPDLMSLLFKRHSP